jgi:hypothetical protein
VLRHFSCETLPVKQLFLGVTAPATTVRFAATAVRFARMRLRGMRRLAVRCRLGRSGVRGIGVDRCGVGSTGGGLRGRGGVVISGTVDGGVIVVYYRRVVSVGIGSVIGRVAASTCISASTAINEAIAAPPVAIAPAGPRTHAQEDAVVEVARPIETDRRATIWRIVIIAIGANGLNTDGDDNLRASIGCKGRSCEQGCGCE